LNTERHAVSLLGDTENPAGQSPEQFALDAPALSRQAGLNDLQRWPPPSTILLFHETATPAWQLPPWWRLFLVISHWFQRLIPSFFGRSE